MEDYELLKPQRFDPQWESRVDRLGPRDENKWLIVVKNRGQVVSTFVPLAVTVDPRESPVELSLKALPGFGSSALVNPGEQVHFELFLRRIDPAVAGAKSLKLDLIYGSVKGSKPQWGQESLTNEVLRLPLEIDLGN